ncbi:MAG: inositol monophosphatase [Acidobacteria bacterium]|nr:inositol monophosphatase [Acidobacteriota bacterium]
MRLAPSFEFASQAGEVAREAGRLLLTYFRGAWLAGDSGAPAAHIRIEYKGDVDLVTEADRRSEELIVGRIRERWPGHGILGEEGTRTQPGSEYQWYVDPLDGTTNFAHGYPVFCVSLGLARSGELISGAIYDPTRDELFAAEKGAGAWLNGNRIVVSPVKALAESLLGTGFPSKKRHNNPNIHFYQHLTLRSHGVRRAGSAALDLACVACGRYDGFWEFNLNPWDTSAGVVLVREAGGMVSDFSGGEFDIASHEVCASNGRIHPELLREFARVFAGTDLEPLPKAGA